MHVCYNGKIIDEEQLNVAADSPALLYGFGLFETIRVLDGEILFYPEHMIRMQRACEELDIGFTHELDDMLRSSKELLKSNNIANGSVRIDCLKSSKGSKILIRTRSSVYGLSRYIEGFRLITAHIRKNSSSPLSRIKSLNYLDNIIAKTKAAEAGFDEALLLNNRDEICEGSISNIFWVNKERLFTPSIECGVLPGITRGQVLEIAEREGVQAEEGSFMLDSLFEADEVFLTNSLMGVMPVYCIDKKRYNIANGVITSAIMNGYNKMLKELNNN